MPARRRNIVVRSDGRPVNVARPRGQLFVCATGCCCGRTEDGFAAVPAERSTMTAARFLGLVRRDVRRLVARWTGEYQYTIDRVIESMMARARKLNLRLKTPEEQARMDFLILLTVQTLNYLHSGRHRVAL